VLINVIQSQNGNGTSENNDSGKLSSAGDNEDMVQNIDVSNRKCKSVYISKVDICLQNCSKEALSVNTPDVNSSHSIIIPTDLDLNKVTNMDNDNDEDDDHSVTEICTPNDEDNFL
jgi:hypothetical protein